MNRRRWLVLAGMCVLGTGPVLAEESVPASAPSVAPIEYSLLQPGLSGEYFVGTALDFTMLGSGFSNVKRTSLLREAVQQEGYDAPTQLALAMKAALDQAGWRTEIEPVTRGRPGLPGRLTRADLPANPQGRYLIDLEIMQLGFAAESNLAQWQPFFTLTWRILGPGGELVVPSHKYMHGPYESLVEENNRTMGCDLPVFHEAMKTPAQVFECMNRGFRDAAAILVPLLREAHVKSGDT
jgi:hypothetical protein